MRRLPALLFGAGLALWARPAQAVVCDGSELVCLDLLDGAAVQATGATMVAGDFLADGFQPWNQGGIDWPFGPAVNLSRGRVEVTVTGLVPVAGGEGDGGKVSLFDACGLAPDDNYNVGLQKMPSDYHEGHVFRFGMDDDGLADGWDAAIISSSDFVECPGYNIQSWQPGESHTITAQWGPEGVHLQIDGVYDCNRPGNGDAFWPASKIFTLGNRCQHYANQQAVARFRDFRLWALGTGPQPDPCGDGHCDPDETCASCPLDCGSCGQGGGGAGGAGGCEGNPIAAVSLDPVDGAGSGQTFTAVYSHCAGASAIRGVQLAVWDAVDPFLPAVQVGYEAGQLYLDGASCAPGSSGELVGSYGRLDCASSSASLDGNRLTAQWSIAFDMATFGGTHGVYLDAKGGAALPEPRLGWTQLGSYTVQAGGSGGTAPPAGGAGGANGAASGAEDAGCGCRTPEREPHRPGGAVGLVLAALALGLRQRPRQRQPS